MWFSIRTRWNRQPAGIKIQSCKTFIAVTLLLFFCTITKADPLFAPYEVQPSLSVFYDPFTLATGNLVGDPLMDIAVAHQEGRRITIIENDNGQMKVVQEISTNYDPFFILAGDFSNDGLDDLVVTDTHGDRIVLYLNHGSEGFVRYDSYWVGNGPWKMGQGDFDHDGILDLVVANGWDDHLRILYGSSELGFSRFHSAYCGWGAGTVVPILIDEDNYLDAVVLREDDGIICFMINNGSGILTLRNQFYVGDHVKAVAVENFNGDNALDLAVLTNDPFGTDDYLTILLNDGADNFTIAGQYDTGSYPVEIIADDFDGDHNIELAVLCYEGGGISTYRGDDEGGFTPLDFIPVDGLIRGLDTIDLDWDGRIDLVVSSRQTDQIHFFMNTSDTLTDSDQVIPQGFSISAYPNPFNPTTTIHYHQEQTGQLSLDLYDTSGRKIRTLLSRTTVPGDYTLKWDGRDGVGNKLSSGIYLLKAVSMTDEHLLKLMLLK